LVNETRERALIAAIKAIGRGGEAALLAVPHRAGRLDAFSFGHGVGKS